MTNLTNLTNYKKVKTMCVLVLRKMEQDGLLYMTFQEHLDDLMKQFKANELMEQKLALTGRQDMPNNVYRLFKIGA